MTVEGQQAVEGQEGEQQREPEQKQEPEEAPRPVTPPAACYEPNIWRLEQNPPPRELPGPGPVEGGYGIDVVVNGEVQPVRAGEYGPEVVLPPDTRYSLRISNANSHGVELRTTVDGLDVGTYLIGDYSICDIERPLKHQGYLCFTPHVDNPAPRTMKIECCFVPPTNVECITFTLYRGWHKHFCKTLELYPTHSITTLLQKAKAKWNTSGSDFILFPGSQEWKARDLEEQGLPLEATVNVLPTDLYFLEHRQISFTFSLDDGRLSKCINFRRELTLCNVIDTLSRQWNIPREKLFLCTSRGVFLHDSFPGEEHLLSLFDMADLLGSGGHMQVLVRQAPPPDLRLINILSRSSGTTYRMLVPPSYSGAEALKFVFLQEGLDLSALSLRQDGVEVQEGDLAQTTFANGATADVHYSGVTTLCYDMEAPKHKALRSKCSPCDTNFGPEAYRVVDLDSVCPQTFHPMLGEDANEKKKIPLSLSVVEDRASEE